MHHNTTHVLTTIKIKVCSNTSLSNFSCLKIWIFRLWQNTTTSASMTVNVK